MIMGARRRIAAVVAAVGIGVGGAAWAASSASASTAAASVAQCSSSQLAVWVSPNLGDGAAGSTYYPLDFTNISSHTCFLVNYPGVSLTTATGKILGSPAARVGGVPSKTINVAPGATAHATLRYVDVKNFPAGACKEANGTYLNVYPPDQFGARRAWFPQPGCTKTGTIYLFISRIAAGVGAP